MSFEKIILLAVLALVAASCSEHEDPVGMQTQPGSLSALSPGNSLLEGAVVTQVGPFNDVPKNISVLPDGKVLVAGTSYNDKLVDLFIARYDRSGRLDAAFGNQGIVTSAVGSGNDRVQAIVSQPDGKLLAVGARHNGQDLDSSVSRYSLDGSLDTTFGQGGVFRTSMGVGNDTAHAALVQPDGAIVVVGTGHDDQGFIGMSVFRLTREGVLDPSFAAAGKAVLRLNMANSEVRQEEATQVALDAQGRIVIAGTVMNGFQKELGVVRLLSNGSKDTSFGNQGQLIVGVSAADDEPTAVAIDKDSKVLLAVSVFNEGKRGVVLYRLSSSGAFDKFGEASRAIGGTLSTANQIRILSDGKILLLGSIYHRDTRSDFAMERYLVTGYLDPEFGRAGHVRSPVSKDNDSINAVWVTPDNHLIVTGVVNEPEKQLGMCLARYDSAGALDPRFGSESFL